MTSTRRYNIGDRRTRAASLGLTTLLYAGGALLLLAASRPAVAPVIADSSMMTFDVAYPVPTVPEATRAATPIPAPPIPSEPVMPVDMSSATPSAVVAAMLAAADMAASQGGVCDLSGPVQTALQGSTDVGQALPTIPVAQRSIANAVMLWDGSWNAAIDRLPPAAVQAIRNAVTQTLSAASEQCRTQAQAGPRLLYLSSAEATTVLVLGSGQWRWQDVADTALETGGRWPVVTLEMDDLATGTRDSRN